MPSASENKSSVACMESIHNSSGSLVLKLRRSSHHEYVPVNNDWQKQDEQPKEEIIPSYRNIPPSLVNILMNCEAPDGQMEEMLMDGLLTPKHILPCIQAEQLGRAKVRLTADKIAKILRRQ